MKPANKIPMVNIYCSPYGDHVIPDDIYATIEWDEPERPSLLRQVMALHPDTRWRYDVKPYPANPAFWHWVTGKDLEAING